MSKPESGRPPVASSPALTAGDVSRVIEMAWEDHTPFEAIESQFGLGEPQVVELMRTQLKRSSFVMWRKRVAGRDSKHGARRDGARREAGAERDADTSTDESSRPGMSGDRGATDRLDVPSTLRG